MLPAPYRWYESNGAAYLDWRNGNVAAVTQQRGQWTVTIRWRDRTLGGPCGSMAQGQRFVTEWIKRRGNDWPSVRPVRWYDRAQDGQRLHKNCTAGNDEGRRKAT